MSDLGIRRLANRVANVVAREIVKLTNDSQALQLVQIAGLQVAEDSREEHDEAEHMQPYGFYAVPLAGAEAVVVFPNGDRAHALAVVVADRRYRPTGGQGGEVGLYTDEGDQIRLGRGHAIVISTSGTLQLGGAGAADGVIKGTSRNTAEQTFLSALSTFVGAVVDPTGAPTAAKTALIGAITAFQSAAADAVSTKVKTE